MRRILLTATVAAILIAGTGASDAVPTPVTGAAVTASNHHRGSRGGRGGDDRDDRHSATGPAPVPAPYGRDDSASTGQRDHDWDHDGDNDRHGRDRHDDDDHHDDDRHDDSRGGHDDHHDDDDHHGGDGKKKVGKIAMMAGGAVALVGVTAAVACLVFRWRRNKRQQAEAAEAEAAQGRTALAVGSSVELATCGSTDGAPCAVVSCAVVEKEAAPLPPSASNASDAYGEPVERDDNVVVGVPATDGAHPMVVPLDAVPVTRVPADE